METQLILALQRLVEDTQDKDGMGCCRWCGEAMETETCTRKGCPAADARRLLAPEHVPDPMTVAYVAIGAARYTGVANPNDNRMLDAGESEFFDRIVQHAPMVDALFNSDTYTGGCFYYDVAEPFGHLAAKHQFTTGRAFTKDEALAIATRLYNEA